MIFLVSCTQQNKITVDENKGDYFTKQNADAFAVKQASTGLEKGHMAPDFVLKTIEGKKIELSGLRNKNPALVYFWTTWCPYCKRDLHNVQSIYSEYKDEVEFIAVDMDSHDDAEKIKKYSSKYKLDGVDFAQFNEDVVKKYQVVFTSTKYAIGKDGSIVYKGSGSLTEEQWRVLFDALLGT